MDCIRRHNGKCGNSKDCPFCDFVERAVHCSRFVPDDHDPYIKTSMMEKEAAWKDVKAKGDAIVAAGGVEILENNPSYIEALVMSGVVDGLFPVCDGGPYRVILSKRSWENKSNVGGWLQGYLCDCKWGYFNGGEPGPGFQGRLCSHSYAAMVVADARARQEFMNDRTAGMKILGHCEECDEYSHINAEDGLCDKCEDKKAFVALAKAMFGRGKTAKKAEETLARIDEKLINKISKELDIEQRGNISIARWSGHQAIFNKQANGDLTKEDFDVVEPNRSYTYVDIDESDTLVILEIYSSPYEGWCWKAIDESGAIIEEETDFNYMQDAIDDLNDWKLYNVDTTMSASKEAGALDGVDIYPIDLEDMAHQGGFAGGPEAYIYQYEGDIMLDVSNDVDGGTGWRWGLCSADGDNYIMQDADFAAFEGGFDSAQEALKHFNDFATTDGYSVASKKVAYQEGDTFVDEDGHMFFITKVTFEGEIEGEDLFEYDVINQDGEALTFTNTDLDYMRKIGNRKTATRQFTYAEMQELEDEVKDKPNLNNADRLKDPDSCMFY